MLVLLPPSETKAPGGAGSALALETLSFPELTRTRRSLVAALVRLAKRRPLALQAALGVSDARSGCVADDARLRTAPTMAALDRYTGVLFDELAYQTLPPAARHHAEQTLVVASALFGMLRPRDMIPAYRLSATTALPDVSSLRALWRPALRSVLAGMSGPMLDLRSGGYQSLAPLPGAVQVRVLRETGGRRSVVSHDNKYAKGRLVREMCIQGATCLEEVAAAADRVADAVEVHDGRIDLVLFGLASGRPVPQVAG